MFLPRIHALRYEEVSGYGHFVLIRKGDGLHGHPVAFVEIRSVTGDAGFLRHGRNGGEQAEKERGRSGESV